MNCFRSRFAAFVVCSAVLGCIVLGVAASSAAYSGDQGIQVSFSIRKRAVTLHEPVYMLFTARNGLRHVTAIHLGKNGTHNFRFTITDPAGATHPGLRLTSGGMGTIGRVPLKSGETYSETLVLDQWYPFDKPGTYKVQAELVDSLPAHPEIPVHVWSSPEMSLVIRPRDAGRLEAVCRELLDTVLKSSDRNAASTAALALSEVRDSVALPYLAELLRSDSTLNDRAVAGLVRIGTPEAVRILKSDLGTPDPSLRAQIWSGLAEIESGIRVTIAD